MRNLGRLPASGCILTAVMQQSCRLSWVDNRDIVNRFRSRFNKQIQDTFKRTVVICKNVQAHKRNFVTALISAFLVLTMRGEELCVVWSGRHKITKVFTYK